MALILGILVGVVLGLTGAGGAALAVPLLMWGMDWSIGQAAPVALLAACCAAASGTMYSWATAHVRYRAAVLMAVAGLVALPVGHHIASMLPGDALQELFALVLCVVALRMWLQSGALADEGVVEPSVAPSHRRSRTFFCRLDRVTGRIVWTPVCAAGVAGVGVGAGFLAGMFGVGGGFLIVPSLRMFSELSIQSAVATSLMAVALISGLGAVVALLEGQMQPWPLILPFVAGAVGGMLAARRLAGRFTAPVLQRMFAVLVAAAACVMALRV